MTEIAAIDGTHDLKLTDESGNTVSLILCDRRGERNVLAFDPTPMDQNTLKTYSGTQKYADMEAGPWSSVAQSDWSGGRGSKDFDNDQSMYYDGYNINTLRPGEIILGPKATPISVTATCSNTQKVGTGIILINTVSPAAATYYEAYRFTAATSVTASSLSVTIAAAAGTVDTGSLQVGLATVNTGVPDPTTLAANMSSTTIAIVDIPKLTYTTLTFTLAATLALTAGTDYFMVFKYTGLDTTPTYGYIITANASTTALSADERKISTNGSDWTSGSIAFYYEPYFTIYGSDKICKQNLFEYKGAMFTVGKVDDNTAPKLYIVGDQGMCETTDTTTTVIKTHSSVRDWAVNEAAGAIFVLVSGTGSDQPQNWRPITLNDVHADGPPITNSFTVSPAFDVKPDDTTQYAIVCSDTLKEVTDAAGASFSTNYWTTASTEGTPIVSDVLVANGAVYFAMGEGSEVVITRMHAYDNSGVWTFSFSDLNDYTAGTAPETAAFTFLKLASDQAGTYIWGAKGGYPSAIYYAPIVDATAWTSSATALTWSSAINVGELGERITGLEVHGDYGNLFVLKEGSIWQIVDKKPYRVDVREMGNTTDYRNGRAHTVHGKYLYFSWHDTILRFIEGYLDTVGPDQAEVGTPTADRAGHFSCLTGYKGMVLGSVDAGTSGVSSVLAYNGQGYCELYSGTSGSRIQNIYVQSTPGNIVDRLWISEGAKIVWIPLSTDPFNHPDSSYYFSTSGYLITSWFYVGLQEVSKLFANLKMVIENTTASEEWVTAEYQLDNSTDWLPATPYTFDTFSEENTLSATYNLDGKRIRFKFSLYSHNGAESPRIIASVLEAAVRIQTKYATQVMCLLEDDGITREGAPDETRLAVTKYNRLKAMMALATPVAVTSDIELITGKYAFVDNVKPLPLEVNDETGKKNKYACQFTLIEVT